MTTERLQGVPATPASMHNLDDVIKGLSVNGILDDIKLKISFSLTDREIVQISDPRYGPEELPQIFQVLHIRFIEDLDEITKTTTYMLNPTLETITKKERIEEKITRIREESHEMSEEEEQQVEDLVELGWDEYLKKYPVVAKVISNYNASSELEEKIGANFVSEAEIQEVMSRLRSINPKRQIPF